MTEAPINREPMVFEEMHPLFVHFHAGHLLRTALELRLPDLVGSAPAPVPELARAAGLDPDLTLRLFRALAVLGVFHQTGPETFKHNELSSLLRADSGDASASLVNAFLNAPWMWRVWDRLTDAVRTGTTPFPSVHGKDFYRFLGGEPQVAEAFNRAMTASLGATNPAVAEALDLSGVRHLVDVGGGQGTLLREVLRRTAVRGTLFDVESALAAVDEELRTGNLAQRCEIVAGDVRESVPAADGYLLRTVLHNWDDDTCVRMLRRCAEAGSPDARVFVVETLRTEEDRSFVPIMDLQMFLLFGGRERTADEFAELFDRAGLRYAGVTPTASPFHIVEARVRA